METYKETIQGKSIKKLNIQKQKLYQNLKRLSKLPVARETVPPMILESVLILHLQCLLSKEQTRLANSTQTNSPNRSLFIFNFWNHNIFR